MTLIMCAMKTYNFQLVNCPDNYLSTVLQLWSRGTISNQHYTGNGLPPFYMKLFNRCGCVYMIGNEFQSSTEMRKHAIVKAILKVHTLNLG